MGQDVQGPGTAAGIYDNEAQQWQRSGPVMWSDVTARPWAAGAAGWAGRRVLDLGCGEGYMSRLVLGAGARSVTGVDVSAQMVARARDAAGGDTRQHYSVGDVSDGAAVTAAAGGVAHDAALAVFVANYLTVAQTRAMLQAGRAVCRDGAELVLVAPHPWLPWAGTAGAPVHFDHGGAVYDDVDSPMEGRLWRLDGSTVTVLNHHKRMQDWFEIVGQSGWQVAELAELGVPADHAHLVDPAQAAVPLHLGLRLRAH